VHLRCDSEKVAGETVFRLYKHIYTPMKKGLTRFTPDEVERLEAAALEFERKDGSVDWIGLTNKYHFDRTIQALKSKLCEMKKKRTLEVPMSNGRSKRRRSNPIRFEQIQAEELIKKEKQKKEKEQKKKEKKKEAAAVMKAKKKAERIERRRQSSLEASLKKSKSPNQRKARSKAKSGPPSKRSVMSYDKLAKTGSQLPLQRVKKVMLSDNPPTKVSKEAVVLVSKATEMFLHWYAKEVRRVALQKNNSRKGSHLRVPARF